MHNPEDVGENILGGVKYLYDLLKVHGWDQAAALREMKPFKITLGDKEYAATPLRITEITAANLAWVKLQGAAAEHDYEKINAGLLELAGIVSDSVRRADPNIPEDHVAKVSTPGDLLYAFKTLTAESCGTFEQVN